MSKVFLIRHGVTDWHNERRVMGHRDIALNEIGRQQAKTVADALAGHAVVEVISSPLVRALQTAEAIGVGFGIEVARDPRLVDFRVGHWEGMPYDEVEVSPAYQRFLADPASEAIPGGENLEEVKTRALAALEQALEDNPVGDTIAVVTHAGVIRVLLTHYLGSPYANYHRIRVSPASISVLEFGDDHESPRILAVNWCPALSQVAS